MKKLILALCGAALLAACTTEDRPQVDTRQAAKIAAILAIEVYRKKNPDFLSMPAEEKARYLLMCELIFPKQEPVEDALAESLTWCDALAVSVKVEEPDSAAPDESPVPAPSPVDPAA